MSGPVAAAIITGSVTVAIAIVAAAAWAVWRVGANRRYHRRIDHIADLQDRTQTLRAANRTYGGEVQQIADAGKQAAADATKGARSQDSEVHNFAVERKVSAEVDQAQAAALDGVRVAETRVDDKVIVELSENWRRMSRLHSLDITDVNAGEEDEAWEWFHQACAEALNSRRGRLDRNKRTAWKAKLDKVVDDSNSTEPDPTENPDDPQHQQGGQQHNPGHWPEES